MEKSSEGSNGGTRCTVNVFHAGDDPLLRFAAEIPSSKETVLIAGFPGSGLVGSIAVQYLVESLSFTHIGDIISSLLPAVSLATAGLAQAPLRLYEKEGMLVVLCDVPISDEGSCLLPSKILEWLCARTVVTEIILIGGVVTGGDGERVFGVATTLDGVEKIRSNCQILPALNITGITGGFLTEACMRKIPATGFLVETNFDVDPRASAAGLSVISSIYSLSLDVDPLIAQADSIEPMLQKLAEDVKKSNVPPTSFDEDIMYG